MIHSDIAKYPAVLVAVHQDGGWLRFLDTKLQAASLEGQYYEGAAPPQGVNIDLGEWERVARLMSEIDDGSFRDNQSQAD